MENERKIRTRQPYVRRVFVAFVLATLVFLVIFSLAYTVSYYNYTRIASQNSVIEQSLIQLGTFLDDTSCSDQVLYESSRRLDEVGGKISLLEKRFGKDDPRVLDQKKLYNELEVKHFEIVKKLDESCDKDFVTVLYFYSNNEDEQDESERMGLVLGTLKTKFPERVMVYSFDSDLEYALIQELKDRYDVPEAPIALFDESEFVKVYDIDDVLGFVDDTNTG